MITELSPERVTEEKAKIDAMSRLSMASLWRNAPIGHLYFRSDLPLYEHFRARFAELGGFSPAISKAIGH